MSTEDEDGKQAPTAHKHDLGSTNTTRAAVGAGKLRTRRRAQSQASRTPEGVSPRGPLKPGRARCRVGRPGLAQFTVCSRHSYPFRALPLPEAHSQKGHRRPVRARASPGHTACPPEGSPEPGALASTPGLGYNYLWPGSEAGGSWYKWLTPGEALRTWAFSVREDSQLE